MPCTRVGGRASGQVGGRHGVEPDALVEARVEEGHALDRRVAARLAARSQNTREERRGRAPVGPLRLHPYSYTRKHTPHTRAERHATRATRGTLRWCAQHGAHCGAVVRGGGARRRCVALTRKWRARRVRVRGAVARNRGARGSTRARPARPPIQRAAATA
eukprot:5172706-Prymnesium_polylepis.1